MLTHTKNEHHQTGHVCYYARTCQCGQIPICDSSDCRRDRRVIVHRVHGIDGMVRSKIISRGRCQSLFCCTTVCVIPIVLDTSLDLSVYLRISHGSY